MIIIKRNKIIKNTILSLSVLSMPMYVFTYNIQTAYADTVEEQTNTLKVEIERLTKERDVIKSKIDSLANKHNNLVNDLTNSESLISKNTIHKEIKEKEKKVQPLDIKSQTVKSDIHKMEKSELTNSMKDEIILSQKSDDLATHITSGDELKKTNSEIEKLTTQLNAYNNLIATKTDQLNELTQLKMPAKGVYTSLYGKRKFPLGEGYDFHTGVDIAGSGNIKATLSGTVTQSGYVQEGYGNWIEIDHGVINGVHLKTRYGHLAKRYVEKGQSVAKGEDIGLMGMTGWATGVHLHFEVYENDKLVDPMPYLERASAY